MLVATHSFAYVDPFDGKKKAVHRGRTRVAESHPVATRFPYRFEPVNRREDARVRFVRELDRAESYDQYVELLDKATARLGMVEQRGALRIA
jgi:hypothetical protein